VKSRALLVLVMLAVWGGLVVARLYELQVERHQEFRGRAERQQLLEVELAAPRGTVYDARGRELAVSIDVESAYALPQEASDRKTFLEAVSGIPQVDRARLREAFDRDRRWTWVARKLDPPTAAVLRGRNLQGLHFLHESKRFYPLTASAGPLLGFVGLDNDGLEGLEARWDSELSGGTVRRTLLRDARRGTLQSPRFSFREAEPGSDLFLTVDASIQYVVERELRRAVDESHASSGTAVVLDPQSGKILAIASVPDFDPNRFADVERSEWRNRVVTDAYEPGSTLKMVTAAAALETNRVDPFDVFDCGMGSIEVDGIRIRDHKPFGLLTFRDVIAQSSNVGAIKIGLTVGGEALHRQLEAFGFGSPTGIDLPGESAGILHPAKSWRRVGTAYVSFGQGISVTPLQLAMAFAAVANGGTLLKPYVVGRIVRPQGEVVENRPEVVGHPISPATARTLERMFEAVVEEGTGKAAAVPGYRVAGKTGTAQIAVQGGYSPDRFVASFSGFVPAREPVLLASIAIHEPRGRYHGGQVAAPVFAAIARQVLPYLGVTPEREAGEAWPGESGPGESDSRQAEPGPRRPTLRAAVEPLAVPAGTLPDLTGLPARQAVALTAALGISPRVHGAGVVRRQVPMPGTPVDAAATAVEIWLDEGLDEGLEGLPAGGFGQVAGGGAG
jgi:cell division protein FtsI (penicillin-binding protein 3)